MDIRIKQEVMKDRFIFALDDEQMELNLLERNPRTIEEAVHIANNYETRSEDNIRINTDEIKRIKHYLQTYNEPYNHKVDIYSGTTKWFSPQRKQRNHKKTRIDRKTLIGEREQPYIQHSYRENSSLEEDFAYQLPTIEDNYTDYIFNQHSSDYSEADLIKESQRLYSAAYKSSKQELQILWTEQPLTGLLQITI